MNSVKHFYRDKFKLLIAAIIVLLLFIAIFCVINIKDASAQNISIKQNFYSAQINDKGRITTGPKLNNGQISSKALFKNNIDLPTKYDSRESDILPEIRNQSPYGDCWSFSTLTAIETDLIKNKGVSKTIDLSEYQLAHFYFNKFETPDPLNLITGDYNYYYPTQDRTKGQADTFLDAGSDLSRVMWFMPTWCGPVLEEKAPYSAISDYSEEGKKSQSPGYISWLMQMAQQYPSEYGPGSQYWKELNCETWEDMNDKFDDWLRAKEPKSDLAFNNDEFHVKNIEEYNMVNPASRELNLDEVKNAVYKHGSVSAAYFENGNDTTYYNKTHNAYYDPNDSGSNHAINIVGWDDNFPIENFKDGVRPPQKGAWLIRNSWGGDSTKESHSSYFWISYYNKCFFNEENHVFAYDVESKSNFDNNYQYDGSSGGGYISIEGSNASVSNVFEATSDFGETLEAISIGNDIESNSVYDLQIYKNLSDESNPSSGTACLDSPQRVTLTSAGYHTIDLAKPIKLSKGNTYSVVLSAPSDVSAITISVASSDNSHENFKFVQKTTKGQSFYGSAEYGQWTDLFDDEYPCVARIKAFTKNLNGDLKDATVSFDEGDKFDYTGKSIEPSVNVKYGDTTLVKDTDYTVEYINNINATTSDYQAAVKITGIGRYAGNKSQNFFINKGNLTVSVNSSSIDIATFPTYKPTFTVSGFVNGESEQSEAARGFYTAPIINKPASVVPGQSYDLVPEGENARNYTFITINPGTLTINPLSIQSAKITILGTQPFVYTGKEQTPNVEVELGTEILVKDKDYTLTYTNNKNVGKSATVTVFGINKYTGSISTNFEIAARTLTAAYNGGQTSYEDYDNYKPSVVVNGFADGESAETLVGYEAPTIDKPAKETITPGEPVTLKPAGGNATSNYIFNYVSGQLNVDRIDLTNASITVDEDCVYTGVAQTPKITVTCGGKTLVQSTDYSAQYFDNIDASHDAYVSITGIGIYQKTKTEKFSISKAKLTATFDGGNIAYEDYPERYTPSITVSGFVHDEGPGTAKGYTAPSVSLPANVEPGEAITRKPEGGAATNYYFVYEEGTLNIGKVDLSNANITIEGKAPSDYSCVYTAEDQRPSVQVLAFGKSLVLNTDYTINYDKNKKVGNAFITITGTEPRYIGSKTVNFVIKPATLTSTFEDVSVEYEKYNQYSPSVKVEGFVGGESKETIDKYEEPTISKPDSVEPGTTYDMISSGGWATNYEFNHIKGTLYVKDKAKIDIASATVSITDVYNYSASEKTPLPNVEMGTEKLIKDVDYTLSYKNNVDAGDDTAIVTITGKGDYTGIKDASFSIRKATNPLLAKYKSETIDYKDFVTYTPKLEKVTGFISPDTEQSQTAAGKFVAPSVPLPSSVEPGGQYTLTPKGGYAKNYNISYESGTLNINCLNLSSATIVYEEGDSFAYTGKSIEPKFSVKLGDETLTKDTDYTVEFANNVDTSTNNYKPTITITGKGKYTGSNTSNFTITKGLLTVSVNDETIDAKDFPGHKATLSVDGFVDGESVETETARSYYVSPSVIMPPSVVPGQTYTLNTEGGSARNYNISCAPGTLTINKLSISDASVSVLGEQPFVYTGQNQTPDVEVKFASETLIKGTDYTVSYTDNKNVGKSAKVTVSGIGKYKDSASASFEIIAKTLDAKFIDDSVAYEEYDSYVIAIDVTGFVPGESQESLEGYQSPFATKPPKSEIEPGQDVTIMPKGGNPTNNYNFNYISGTLSVAELDISKASVSLKDPSKCVYNGLAQEPEVIVELDGKILNPSTDYTVVYDNNIKASDNATVTVKGKGDYAKSTPPKSFTILQAKLTAKFDGGSVAYESYPSYIPTVTVAGFVNGETASTARGYRAPWVELPSTVEPGATLNKAPQDGKADDYYFVYEEGVLSIGKVDISNATITIEGMSADKYSTVYNGSEQKPAIQVNASGKSLEPFEDFVVQFMDNKNIGNASVVVSGTGQKYTGSKTLNFTIKPAILTSTFESITVKYEDYDKYIPTVKVEGFVGGETKETITHYEEPTIVKPASVLPGSDNPMVSSGGVATNYEFKHVPGHLYITDKEKIDISKADVTISGTFTYSGSPKEPLPVVKLGELILVKDRDYTLSYSNNVNVSKNEDALCSVIGKGDYIGQKDTKFKISPAALTAVFKSTSVHYLDYAAYAPLIEVSGFVPGESAATASGYTAPSILDRPDVKNITPGNTYTFTPTGGSADNYIFTTYTGGELKVLELSASEQDISSSSFKVVSQDQVYNRRSHTPIAKVYLIGTDNSERELYDWNYSCTGQEVVDAANDIQFMLKAQTPFTGERLATYNILPAKLTATYPGATINLSDYKDYDPVVNVTGFVGGETEKDIDNYLAPQIDKPKIVEEGKTYELAPHDGVAKNYVFEYNSGLLQINKTGGGEVVPVSGKTDDSALSSATSDFTFICVLIIFIAIIISCMLILRYSFGKVQSHHTAKHIRK